MAHGHICEREADHRDHAHHDHDHDHDHDPPPEETSSVQSLRRHIDVAKVRALNATHPESGGAIVREWSDRFATAPELCSDADEQLILHVPFDGSVKLKSILLRCPASVCAPKDLKVFVNRPDLDFSNIAEVKATESFECVQYDSAADLIEYPVKIRLYNNVKTLTLFFEHNWSDDEEPTKVWYLGFRGDWTEVKDAPVAISYEAFANPKDHKAFAEDATRTTI